MKILFLSAASNIHTVRWVNALTERGYEVHLTYNANHKPNKDIISNAVFRHELKFSGVAAYYLNAFEVYKLSKQIKPDIVNVHYASGYGTLARFARLKPSVLSVWGSDVYDFPYQSKLKMKIVKKNISYASIVASTSYSMADQVKKLMGKNMDIPITPFGVDTHLFKPLQLEKKKQKFVFGVVKTLERKYGIEYIIKAFKAVADKLEKENNSSTPVLEIYGKGTLENELKNLCKQLNVADRVFFKGYIANKDVPLVINNMDVFCLGSVMDSESFGVAAVEAMACEVPVIATDVSGFKEVMIHGETGYIVPRKDSDSMAEKMYELLKYSKVREELGKNARARVIEFYDWDKNVSEMEIIYKSLVNNPR
ncbi:glycosyltransferase [Clostridium oryzae]|uniref:GDP-mannose-dependent alpha-(1-6)-phosphatidylinositol monomannoside mannosyltransferase n=1 Tax=Clostridium oryzae TaxID=1450648 RepID=A0A1V4INM0_9CLOT|nr:glycosyltransferase [Clostridium oryzae]OPJ61648.1 GDP-mannose-dependent alpha-(1-6)-phosphatidylinositol monomannoside mannosyltransferase [Clostridium oryzae]